MEWNVDPGADRPPSRQIFATILDAVARGELGSGAQLPSVRQLAAQALVNHNTAARAYRDLEQAGVVQGKNGLGVFVTSDGPRLAREARRAETLREFARVANEALRSGHDARALAAVLAKITRKLSESSERKSA
jgi:DNA-binding transcriptional regulator YhcF (GntR family)